LQRLGEGFQPRVAGAADLRRAVGRCNDRMLTCDLTKEYVAINGDYRS